ncbi:MAG: acyl-CoA dehydrogenase [Actinobacteria bacterium]|nr:acyl-CoA dehydrogenase [Actinomycetota bacterium]
MSTRISPRDLAALTDATRDFIREEIQPLEEAAKGDIEAAGGDRVRVKMQHAAKAAGVFAPQVASEFGGHNLNMVDRVPIFEEAGYSLFGPLALNVAAPDEGNIHLLQHVANEEQRDRYLRPLARGEFRSAFAMTEPAPGAGSDPSALRSHARRVDRGWVLSGHKHFITGADGVDFYLFMARTKGMPGDRGGATMFLVPADTPGIELVRHLETIDRSMIGGHCELTFTDVWVPDEAILGDIDLGFDFAQWRLGPARMTHVMRWLGAARRAHDIALAYVVNRRGFGRALGELGMTQQLIADNEIDLAATRALLMTACSKLDGGESASQATSIAKVFGAEAICRVVDRSMQMCGGLGMTDDLMVARIYREVRPFRVYDGASEVHRWAIAKRAFSMARTQYGG